MDDYRDNHQKNETFIVTIQVHRVILQFIHWNSELVEWCYIMRKNIVEQGPMKQYFRVKIHHGDNMFYMYSIYFACHFNIKKYVHEKYT